MHVSATLLIWGLFLFVLPTLCYTEAGLRRGTKVINFDHHLGACEQGQADASHWGIELVLHNGDGAQPFWWKLVFSIGSLICFSALSSTVPGTVPASLDRGSASHVFIDRCLRVLRFPVSQECGAFVPSRRDNLLKKHLEAPIGADCRAWLPEGLCQVSCHPLELPLLPFTICGVSPECV